MKHRSSLSPKNLLRLEEFAACETDDKPTTVVILATQSKQEHATKITENWIQSGPLPVVNLGITYITSRSKVITPVISKAIYRGYNRI